MTVNYSELSDSELHVKYVTLGKEIAKYNNFQMAKKILMNSLFGAAGNQGFRFYDPRIAEGITLTGQYFIQAVGNAIDAYISKLTKSEEKSTFYQDTDSCYVALHKIVEKFILPQLGENYDTQKVIDAMDKISDDKITPVINIACDDIAQYTNSLSQLMNFKREALSDRGVFCSKKKYALNVYDNEGVRYAEPKIKIMGLEIVRSSTPAPIRKMLKDAVKIVLTGDEQELQSQIDGWKSEFLKMPPEEIAFPRGVQKLDHYAHNSNIYQKGCPIHVRAALLFNHLVRSHSLDNNYPLITDGDKIKFLYMKTPNSIHENVFGFIDKFPRELNIHRYIDYELMWEKAFIAPLDNIINTIGWTHKEEASLESLFE
jgi:DNA polymerase elongation subunit (family B)